MIERCPADEELYALADLPAVDPRLAHLQQCPRCRARLRSFRDFLAEPAPPADARERAARRTLAEALDREILGTQAPSRAIERPRPAAAWWRVLLSPPVLRPALGLCAVALVVFGAAQIVSRWQEGRPSGVVRGGAGATAAPEFRLARIALPDGRPALEWTRVPAADQYGIVCIGADLVEIGRIAAGRDTIFALEPGRLPAGATGEPSLICRVVAYRAGDEIARSNLVTVAPPR